MSMPLHAVLVGIDAYTGDWLPDIGQYMPLGGCVNDAQHVRSFLLERFAVPESNLTLLLAPRGAPALAPERVPTYENMVRSLREAGRRAQPGEQLLFYYAGHGGRAPTCVPAIKGATGLDEALVPVDIHKDSARYLRDVELALLFDEITQRGVYLTVVLDACHSGGISRGPASRVRGPSAARGADGTRRPADSLVAPTGALAALWRAQSQHPSASGWLSPQRGAVLLAACQSSEAATEFALADGRYVGALTHFLLEALGQPLWGGTRPEAAVTYKALHERVLARIRSQFTAQTPQLEGEIHRQFLGGIKARSTYAVTVLGVTANRVRLAVGRMHPIGIGAQFELHPPGADVGSTEHPASGTATLISLDSATESHAELEPGADTAQIVAGAQAVLIHPGPLSLCRRVAVLKERRIGDSLQPEPAERRHLLTAIEAAISEKGRNWLMLAPADEAADFVVMLGAEGEYVLADSAGQPLPIDVPWERLRGAESAGRVVTYLRHLARFRAVEQLANTDARTRLAGKLLCEWEGTLPLHGYDPYQRILQQEPEPLADTSGEVILPAGVWAFLRITNLSRSKLNIAGLDLQSDGSIVQFLPLEEGRHSIEIEAGESHRLPLYTSVPEQQSEVRDTLKFLATEKDATTSFRWLCLPPLVSEEVRGGTSDVPGTPLEELFEQLTAETPKERVIRKRQSLQGDWTCSDVSFRVRR